MRVCHGFSAEFDDPNLVSCAGLAPVLQLAERAGLHSLVAEHVRIDKPGGGNARLKVPALVAGMIAGADSIDDMALLGHGAMGRLFTGVRAPSTPVFTNSPLPMLQAEKPHRAHAIVEQVIADLKNGPLAHLPSGSFSANSAWLVCTAMAFNLTRAAGALASVFHTKATTGTIRAQLINVPSRLARSARKTTLHSQPTGPGKRPGRRWQKAPGTDHQPRPDPSTPSNQDQPEQHVETTGPPGQTSTPSAGQTRPVPLRPPTARLTVDPG